MPFTFSHPAVAIPFKKFSKNKLSLTGLVVGSIAPDCEYFIRFDHRSSYSHTWPGIFWFDLPLSLLIAFLYHYVIRDLFIDNAPLFLKQRLVAFRYFNWSRYFFRNLFFVLFSIIIGAFSHLVWDRITHRTVGVMDKVSSATNVSWFTDDHITYAFFWDMSSLLGILLIAYFIWKLPVDRRTKPGTNPYSYWIVVITTGLLLFCYSYFLEGIRVLDNVVIASINGLFIGAFMYWVFSKIFAMMTRKKAQ